MNTGQMLLVLAALITFSMLAMNVNRSVITSTETTYGIEAVETAKDIGQSFITEAHSKPYDLYTVNNTIEDLSDLTNPYSLGPATGESYENFNDVDDFDGLVKTINTPRLGTFTVSMMVYYVDPDNPDVKVTSHETQAKLITVSVTNPFLEKDPETGEPIPVVLHRLKTFPMSSN